jgi:O-antigen biosynthesis protein
MSHRGTAPLSPAQCPLGLVGPDGSVLGYLERIVPGDDGLLVEGWVLAEEVVLEAGVDRSSAVPDIPREDVSRSVGCDPVVGFSLHLACTRPPRVDVILLRTAGAGGTARFTLDMDAPFPTARAGRDGSSLRIVRLFDRYARRHLVVTGAGFPLNSAKGSRIGHVDRIEMSGGGILVTGWVQADRVALLRGAERASTSPAILRRDVEAALGIGPEVGFDLRLPAPDGPDGPPVVFEARGGLAGAGLLARVPLPAVTDARRRLMLPFVRALLRAAPAVAGWALTRRPKYRARVKTLLGLDAAPPAEPVDARLFADTPPADLPADAGITIVLPVYNAFSVLPEVLDRVRRHTDVPWHLILIEDLSTDPAVRPFLRDWVAGTEAETAGRVTLIENARNLGFIGSTNLGLGLALSRKRIVVLLNSDALVPEGWASRLIRPILSNPDVASVTPASNDAEILSVPRICVRTPLAPGQGDAIDRVARRIDPDRGAAVLPTGVGFCMAMNPAFLARVPSFDTVFGRGYGEEVDWCQKVRALGGLHIGLPSLFVEHRGGESFGAQDKLSLVARNNATVARRYPRYDAEVQEFLAQDPMATARLALAVAWAGSCGTGPVCVYLGHAMGGGADRYLDRRIEDGLRQGVPAVVLRVGGPLRWQVEVATPAGRTTGATSDAGFVQALLGALPAPRIVYSCGVGDPDPLALPDLLIALAALPGASVEVLFHDFFPVSPSYTLLGADGRFRGVPLPDGPHAGDPTHAARRIDGTRVTLAGWQAAWARLIARADDVVVFSQSSRDIVATVFPQAAPRLSVRPHRMLSDVPRLAAPAGGGPATWAVLGNIGLAKGAAVIRDLAHRIDGRAGARLVVIGNVDPAFALPPSAHVHGAYDLADLPTLARRYGVGGWIIPSVWPETFSYAVHEALATGLPVLAFDLGAQGAAVREAPNGQAVPFDPDADLAGRLLRAAWPRLEGEDPRQEQA